MGRERRQTAMQLQRSSACPTGALELGRPIRVVLDRPKEIRPSYPYINQALDVGCPERKGITLGKEVPFHTGHSTPSRLKEGPSHEPLVVMLRSWQPECLFEGGTPQHPLQHLNSAGLTFTRHEVGRGGDSGHGLQNQIHQEGMPSTLGQLPCPHLNHWPLFQTLVVSTTPETANIVRDYSTLDMMRRWRDQTAKWGLYSQKFSFQLEAQKSNE